MKVILVFILRLFMLHHVVADECEVVPITQWGGSELNREEPLMSPVGVVVIQHTVTPECFRDDECEKLLRNIRSYQMNIGFNDIGQSFLIGGNGKAYAGSGWHHIGAHTLHYNNRSVSLSFIGNFQSKTPSVLSLRAAELLLDCGVKNSFLSQDYHLVGHRQLSQTQSPGDALQNVIQSWPHWVEKLK